MKREKKGLFDERVFEDVAVAQIVADSYESAKQKNKIGLIIGIFVPVIDFVFGVLLTEFPALCFGMDSFLVWFLGAFIFAVIAYLISGTFGKAMKFVWRVTTIGWVILPIFPLDVIVAWVAFALSGMLALVLPFLVILVERFQINKDYKQAKRFLDAYEQKVFAQ